MDQAISHIRKNAQSIIGRIKSRELDDGEIDYLYNIFKIAENTINKWNKEDKIEYSKLNDEFQSLEKTYSKLGNLEEHPKNELRKKMHKKLHGMLIKFINMSRKIKQTYSKTLSETNPLSSGRNKSFPQPFNCFFRKKNRLPLKISLSCYIQNQQKKRHFKGE